MAGAERCPCDVQGVHIKPGQSRHAASLFHRCRAQPHLTTNAPAPPHRSAAAGRGPAAAHGRAEHTTAYLSGGVLPVLWPSVTTHAPRQGSRRGCTGLPPCLTPVPGARRGTRHTASLRPSPPTCLGACSTIFTLSSVMTTFCIRLFTTPLASAEAGGPRRAQTLVPADPQQRYSGTASNMHPRRHGTCAAGKCGRAPLAATPAAFMLHAPAVAVTSL